MTMPGTRFVPGEEFFTDWFSRGADNMLLRAQVIDFVSTPTVTIRIFTKNADDTSNTDGTVVQSGGVDYTLSLSSADAAGDIKQMFVESTATAGHGLKELVRLKISTTGSGSLLGRVFPPIWYDSASP